MSPSKTRLFLVLAFCVMAGPLAAQEWPTKVVKFVSPYPPSGSVDPLARIFAAKLGESLHQQFIVENRTGASGVIGTDYVAKSAPDGYTFVFIFDTHAVHKALNPNVTFDPVKDFAPVMIVGTAPMVVTTGTMKPYKRFGDVLAAAKAKPDTITMGNVGNGSLAHLTTIVLNQAAGVHIVPVPYKGGGPLSTDLMGGQVELAMASTAAQAQHVRNGKMRALALTGDKRSHTMPDVPTLKEQRINLHRHPIAISNADGVAILEGEVGDIAAKKLALELAASVANVRGIVDRLRVAPGERRGDGAIRDSLARMLLEQPEWRNCTIRSHVQEMRNSRTMVLRQGNHDSVGDIEIAVTDGVITLEGHVISLPHRLYAGVLAWWTPGRRDVVNALELRPRYEERDDEVTEALGLVLEADPAIDASQIRPSCAKWVVTLEGSVPSEEQKRRAELDAWYLSGVERVINKLRIAA